ncbi:MAG: MAPEG family protein [Pseudomonadota bacterium]|jgi:hypothetical protein
MTISFWCVLIAGLIPYLSAGIAKSGGGYDNRNPREWLAKQTGRRARANSAQKNSFEAFPLFAAAVLVAALSHAPQGRVDAYAELFVAARVLYVVAYVFDFALARTLLWTIGIGSVISIFCAA